MRTGGCVRLRDYAVISDGRSTALVVCDGSGDWLGLLDLDSPAGFGTVLYADRGGRFLMEPSVPYRSERRCLHGTNVLETTFVTALTPHDEVMLAPMRELQRHIDCVFGTLPRQWSLQPRFGCGNRTTRSVRRAGIPVATASADAQIDAALAISAEAARSRFGRTRPSPTAAEGR